MLMAAKSKRKVKLGSTEEKGRREAAVLAGAEGPADTHLRGSPFVLRKDVTLSAELPPADHCALIKDVCNEDASAADRFYFVSRPSCI